MKISKQLFMLAIIIISVNISLLVYIVNLYKVSSNDWVIMSSHTKLHIQNNFHSEMSHNPIEKPQIVIGIMSAEGNRFRRDVVRNTWLSSLRHSGLPFDVHYKFTMDTPSDNNEQENKLYNDIVYLNLSDHGYRVNFSEKLYTWFAYAVKNYPDAALIGKSDDDVFPCVHNLFNRLSNIYSPTLYYGYKHRDNPDVSRESRHDEMFIIIGRKLIERIVQRQFLFNLSFLGPTKNGTLIGTHAGGQSLGHWIQMLNNTFKDVHMLTDKDRMVHLGNSPPQYSKSDKIAVREFCFRNILFHKASPNLMYMFHHFYGYLKTGGKISTFDNVAPVYKIKWRNIPNIIEINSGTNLVLSHFRNLCDHWAVTTTKVATPSRAVLAMLADVTRFVVVVADDRRLLSEEYCQYLSEEIKSRIRFLSFRVQKFLYPLLSDFIPWNHSSRKNIGYMFALHHGAKTILEFDSEATFSPVEMLQYSKEYVTECDENSKHVFDHRPYFFHKDVEQNLCDFNEPLTIAVEQSVGGSLRNRKLPFSSATKQDIILVVPKQRYTVFSSDMTIWTSSVFPYIAFPVTVSEEISQLIRGLIAQFFMHKRGLLVSFRSQELSQTGNTTLKAFLDSKILHNNTSQSLIDILYNAEQDIEDGDIEGLYLRLYRLGYFEYEDLNFIKIWIKTLESY